MRLADKAAALEAAALAFADRGPPRCAGPTTRPIRLTAPRVNFSENLAAAISDFQAEHPGVRFEFVATYRNVDLVAGEADIGIRIAPEITDDRLICRKLTDATASLYAAKAYAARHGLPASEAGLGAHTFVTLDRDIASFPMQRWLLERIRPEQVVSRCSELEALVAAIRAGLAIGPLATGLASEDPSLVRCFPPPEGTSVPVWLVIGPDAYRRPEVQGLRHLLRAAVPAIHPQVPVARAPRNRISAICISFNAITRHPHGDTGQTPLALAGHRR